MHSRNYIGQVPFYQNVMLLWDLSISPLALSLSLSQLKFVDCNPLHNFLLKLSDISKKNSEVLSYFITIL